MQILNTIVHAVQEDALEKVAEAIATVIVRHKLAENKTLNFQFLDLNSAW